MHMNVQLVKISQFLCQFSKLEICHKPGKEHIVSDALSCFANANTNLPFLEPEYSELDALFTYTTTLVDIYPDLIKRIIDGYKANEWWSRLLRQVEDNEAFGGDKAIFSFVKGILMPTDSGSYFTPWSKLSYSISLEVSAPSDCDLPPLKYPEVGVETAAPADKKKLFYHVDKVTGVHCLCIPPSVTTEIITLAHGAGHPGFSQCFEIITCFWFIQGLIRMFWSYIQHCPQCLALQTWHHPPYDSLQPIQLPSIPFYTLTLDFILALSMTVEGFNAIMLVTCKYSKRVTLIPKQNTWSAKDWALALLFRLDLIDWGLPRELITDRDPEFLSQFWISLFKKLGVQMLYSIAYHP